MGAMTTALPVLNAVGQGVSLFSEVSGGNSKSVDNRALQELQAKQAAQISVLQQNADLSREKIALAAAESEDARKAALRRAVARQRAKTGASGISSAAGGSSEAVLLGLFEESEAERVEREKVDNLRLSALDQDIEQQNRANILQRTQLQQRQNLSNIASGEDRFQQLRKGLNIVGQLF